MPDATHGVPVWRDSPGRFVSAPTRAVRQAGTEGRWYPVDVAAARDAVIEAAREYREWDGNRNGIPNREGILLDTRRLIETRAELDAALDRLDAIRNDKEKDR